MRRSVRLFEQSDRRVECCRTQVHVALSHRQILVPRQLLNRPCWRATHRQMRTERVPQDMHPIVRQTAPCEPLAWPVSARSAWSAARRRPDRAHARSADADARSSAAANRLVSGTCRRRPPLGVVTCPFQSDRRMQTCRFTRSTSDHSSAIISPHRNPCETWQPDRAGLFRSDHRNARRGGSRQINDHRWPE